MDIDLKEELKKVINFSLVTSNRLRYKRNLSKNKKEMIEYLEDHISKITDIISGVLMVTVPEENVCLILMITSHSCAG